jgi:hypothetical protein
VFLEYGGLLLSKYVGVADEIAKPEFDVFDGRESCGANHSG